MRVPLFGDVRRFALLHGAALLMHHYVSMSARHEQVTTIAERARALGPLERVEYVRRACGGDETLLSQVLSALGEEESWAEDWGTSTAETCEREAPLQFEGQRLGKYRIVSRIGSGGMGEVYLAERDDQEYQQRVAIKLVRSGAFSQQVHARLRMERQILASLQHPNIARLLDGGRAPDGTPYLVMEYIDGEPIDAWCDRRRLTLQERLQLVRVICSAVHYAHQNLIVHRDLKPNNILITPDGAPKLLDFGIAKLLEARYDAQTVAVTHMDYRVLTPSHASPEQVRGETITTGSDVYVLGVLLYELLCGQRPFQLVGATLSDMERIICEQDAPTPSAATARMAQQSPERMAQIAAARSTTPSRLQRDLCGDLDDIVSMAMRKEPERRYSSAEQLGVDIDRWLAGQPVLATRDTLSYRLRKFLARHTIAAAATAAAAAALAAFTALTFIQSQRIAYERDLANTERTRAEQVSSFLVELFQLSDPSHSRGAQVTARELLDIGARRVSLGLADQPETRATLLGTIGRVYNSLGLYSDSIPLLEEALRSQIALHGPRHPEVAKALGELGAALCERGDLDACDERLAQALDMQQQLLGESAIDTAPLLAHRAQLAQLRGSLDEAERLYGDALEIYVQHNAQRTPPAASVISDLAGLRSYRGDHQQAAALYRTALDIDRQTLGADHPHVGMHLHNLAFALHAKGDLEAAEPLYAEGAQILEKVLGERHPQTLDAMSNYGRFLHRKGDLERAGRIFSVVLERNRQARGAQHAYVGHDLVNLGLLRLDLGQIAEAERDLRDALDIYAHSLPPEHPYVASALTGLARAQLDRGADLERVEPALRKALGIAEKSFAADSPTLAAAQSALRRLLLSSGRAAEAEPLLRASYPALVRTQGESAAITRQTRAALDGLQKRADSR